MINSSALSSPIVKTHEGILNNEQYAKFEHLFNHFLWPLLISFGVVTNILNIVVFIKIGPRDSVTFSFLVLSISDLMMLLSSGVMGASAVYRKITTGQRVKVSGFSLAGYFGFYQMMFAETSMGITTYIAVTRCCCVAMALHFKDSFTFRRTIVILTIIILTCLFTRGPVLCLAAPSWHWSTRYNMSRLTTRFADEYFTVFDVITVLNKTIYPNVVLVIVIICSFILSRALIQTSKVRSAMVGSKNSTSCSKTKSPSESDFSTVKVSMEISVSETQNSVEEYSHDEDRKSGSYSDMKSKKIGPVKVASYNESQCDIKRDVKTKYRGDGKEPKALTQTLSDKEIGVVKAVTLLTIFLSVTVFFLSLRAIAELAIPGFEAGGIYSRMQGLIISIAVTFLYINADVNFVVYVRFNSKFRRTLLDLLWRRSP